MASVQLILLIKTSSADLKGGLDDYFSPPSVSATTSGSGGILGGTALGDDGAKGNGSRSVIEELAPESPNTPEVGQSDNQSGQPLNEATEQALRDALQKKEEAAFESAAQSLRQAMQSMPELAELSKQLLIDQTPEGLRIQLVDQEGRSMYETGSAKPNPRAQILLRAVAKVVNQLPNRVTISGHTSVNSNGRTADGDWPLSAARANAAREIMQGAGVAADRVYQVSGKANSDPLYPDDPMLAGNRRIAIVMLREKPVLPPA
jgi:chemotaxis protein MotB